MEFETIELTKDVLIFKNVLKDKERVQKFLTKAREDGYVDPFFNVWTQYREKISYYKSDPRHMPEYKTSNEYSAEFMRECIDIFFKCLKIYKENYLNLEYFEKYNWNSDMPTSLDELEKKQDWSMGDFLILENVTTGPNMELSMPYHIDRKTHPYANPTMFNFNIYMNDDYEGGAIRFIDIKNARERHYEDKNGKNKKYYEIDDVIEYQMEAGDAMLFRTDHFHAVSAVKGKKYYARQFIIHPMSNEYQEQFNLLNTKDLEEFVEKEEKFYDYHKIMPFVFKSVNDIDIDVESWKMAGRDGIPTPFVLKCKCDICNE